jgi:hypothetical protein
MAPSLIGNLSLSLVHLCLVFFLVPLQEEQNDQGQEALENRISCGKTECLKYKKEFKAR